MALGFLTRLPVRRRGADTPAGPERSLSRALSLAPLVGVLVGLSGAAVFWLARWLGLPPEPSSTARSSNLLEDVSSEHWILMV